jgi:hypothetical protein
MNSASSSARLTVIMSAFARMSLQARCQCGRSSRLLPMEVMYRTPRGWCAACRRLWSGGAGLGFGRGTQDATTCYVNSAQRRRVESGTPAMKTKTYFAFRIDVWDSSGDNLAEHLAGVEDFAMAVAAYWAAIQSRPKDKITLRQGARVVLKNWTD